MITKKNLLLVLSVLASGFVASVDFCDSIIFFKEGAKVTMASYDEGGKLLGKTTTRFEKVEKTATATTVLARHTSYDKKDKITSNSEYTIRCENHSLIFDMRMMVPDQQMNAYQNMEATVEVGSDLLLPTSLTIGQVLPDARATINFKPKDNTLIPHLKMEISITNRKVEALEKITTPAGSFDCYKISEHSEFKTIVPIKIKVINWVNFEVGTVKSESHRENGKLLSRTELIEISR